MIFKELKVVELASVLAGPGVGQFFAELGAEVIKVENATSGGDVTRTWKITGENDGDLSAYFCSVNWGKKSIAIDLTTDFGRHTVHRLVKRADIVILSYKPGDAARLQVDYETLRRLNSKIICGEITGYGPDNDRVGYDAVIQAESGFMDLNGEKDGQPVKMPVALVDVLAGHQLKEGLLVALLKRDRTGEGERVSVSLIQSAVASLANQATNWLIAKKLPTRQGSKHPNIAPYGESFVASDGRRILLAVGSDRQFAGLCRIIGHDALPNDPRFRSNQDRVRNRMVLDELLSAEFRKAPADQWMEKLNRMKIPAGIIQNVKDALELESIERLFLRSGNLVGLRTYVAGALTGDLLPPPHFGEHTDEILALLA